MRSPSVGEATKQGNIQGKRILHRVPHNIGQETPRFYKPFRAESGAGDSGPRRKETGKRAVRIQGSNGYKLRKLGDITDNHQGGL